MTCLIENSYKNPFNILYCDDVYFDTYTEKELTLELMTKCKEYIKSKEEEFKKDKFKIPNRELSDDIVEIFKYLNRFFIGGGRIMSFVSFIKEPISIPKLSKNVHFNIEFSFKEYKEVVNNINKSICLDFFLFGDEIMIGDIFPLSGKTGGNLFYYPKFKISKYIRKIISKEL